MARQENPIENVPSPVNGDNGKKKNKKVLSLILIMLPSLIIAGNYGFGGMGEFAMKVLVLLLQFIVVKNILDDYYSYVD